MSQLQFESTHETLQDSTVILKSGPGRIVTDDFALLQAQQLLDDGFLVLPYFFLCKVSPLIRSTIVPDAKMVSTGLTTFINRRA